MKHACFALIAVLMTAIPTLAQGRYDITPPSGPVKKVTLATVAGHRVVIDESGNEVPGATWEVLDADTDGKADDIRITESSGGKLDMPNGALGTGIDDGDCHDGNVAYPGNKIPNCTWERG
jgi:hypothetical protein